MMTGPVQYYAREFPWSITLALGSAALLVVGAAWVFQLAGYLPCQLCLWQRIPYYIAGPLLVFVTVFAFFRFFKPRVLQLVLVLTGTIFILSMMLAGYHSGVEWGFWQGPTSCGAASNFSTTDASDLLGALSSTRPPSCDEAAGRFLGLSFAGWNFVASAGLAIACFIGADEISNKTSTNGGHND